MNPETPSSAVDSAVTRRQAFKYLAAAAAAVGTTAYATPAEAQGTEGGVTLPSGFVVPTSLQTLLSGKTALITGAARGIGQAIAAFYAAAGANVVGVDIAAQIATAPYALASPNDLAYTGEIVRYVGGKFIPVVADTRSLSAMQGAVNTAISNFGRVDILVSNAGINPYNTPIQSITDAQWQDVIDVNLTGYANVIRAAAPNMIKNKSGVIVCTASVDGRQGEPRNVSYAVSKWGVIGLIKSVALDLGQYGIRVNGLAPGTTETVLADNPAGWAWTNPSNPTREGWLEANQMMNALPVPILQPEDIASGALFLASPLGRYVSGTIVDIALGSNARYTA